MDVTSVISALVDHECYEFVASNALGGDPWPYVRKVLTITFNDGSWAAFAEGSRVSLKPILTSDEESKMSGTRCSPEESSEVRGAGRSADLRKAS